MRITRTSTPMSVVNFWCKWCGVGAMRFLNRGNPAGPSDCLRGRCHEMDHREIRFDNTGRM